jgi:ectoine hydroxylase-related dioxygenase (phytanoyl-CoA dioxygenase family)
MFHQAPTDPTRARIRENFERDGYLVVEEALSSAEVESLRHEATEICRGNRGDFPGILAGKAGESEHAVLSRYLCIHFPHKISKTMTDMLHHPRVVEVLTAVIGPNVKSMQSMLFIKASGKPGQAWHQDEQFVATRDRSLTGAWIALDDATVENGCLWAIPGSHRAGVIYPQRPQDDPRFDCSDEAYQFPYTDNDAVPLEVKAGSAIVFNGYLLHRSLPNRTVGSFRRVLANHYMSAESLLPWSNNGRLGDKMAAMADFRDIVLIAGKDPYAWKGIESVMRPHVRREKEGGCKPVAPPVEATA